MSIGRWSIALAVAVAAGAVAPKANAALYWTPWVSEEGGSPATYCSNWDEGAVGFGCSGNYCDNVRVFCETMPYGVHLDPSTDYWSAWFSEEQSGIETHWSVGWYPYDSSNYKVCEPTWTAGIMSGVKCSGSNCDNMSIECTVPLKADNTRAYVNRCSWSQWQSEEQGSIDFGPNRYITAAKCSGSYCDNVSFYVCSLIP